MKKYYETNADIFIYLYYKYGQQYSTPGLQAWLYYCLIGHQEAYFPDFANHAYCAIMMRVTILHLLTDRPKRMNMLILIKYLFSTYGLTAAVQ